MPLMPSKEFLQDLAKSQAEWEAAEAKERPTLPDGPYQARITDVTLGYSKKENKQMVISLEIVSGEQKGKSTKVFYGMSGKEKYEWVKALFNTLGIPIPVVVTDIAKIVGNMKDLLVAVQVKTKDQYTNVYINKVLNPKDLAPTTRVF